MDLDIFKKSKRGPCRQRWLSALLRNGSRLLDTSKMHRHDTRLAVLHKIATISAIPVLLVLAGGSRQAVSKACPMATEVIRASWEEDARDYVKKRQCDESFIVSSTEPEGGKGRSERHGRTRLWIRDVVIRGSRVHCRGRMTVNFMYYLSSCA